MSYFRVAKRLPFISSRRHRRALAVHPSTSDEPSYNVDIHDLTTHKMYSTSHHCKVGGLLPRLFTLTASGGYFLLHYSAIADSFPLGNMVLCVARTFLTSCDARQTGRLLFLLDGKDSNSPTELGHCTSRNVKSD
jgi:hypothetical protein